MYVVDDDVVVLAADHPVVAQAAGDGVGAHVAVDVVEIAAADDPEAELEKIKARLNKVTSPIRSAELFNVEDIIDPRDTGPLLCVFADLAWRKLRADQMG